MAAWHTLESIRTFWSGAPKNDTVLTQILAVSKVQVIAFAPALLDTDPLPDNYQYGQYLQARAIWDATKATLGADADGVGIEPYQIRATDMSPTIQRILRPKTGAPKIG